MPSFRWHKNPCSNEAKFLSFPTTIASPIVDYSGYGSFLIQGRFYLSLNQHVFYVVGGYLDQAPEERRKWQQVLQPPCVLLPAEGHPIAPRQIEGDFDHVVVVD